VVEAALAQLARSRARVAAATLRASVKSAALRRAVDMATVSRKHIMPTLDDLLKQNRAWAARKVEEDPEFFQRLSQQQAPQYLWIGCSDSRVPANEIVGLPPGEMFVHRNIANVVLHADLNCLSVLQFAVDVLRVTNVIVCGHYGCGGVQAALRDDRFGLVDNWLRHVQDVRIKYQAELDELETERQRVNRLCELNVIEQVVNVSQTTIVRDAWARGQQLAINGWIYDVGDGLLRDLAISVTDTETIVTSPESARKTIRTAPRSEA
jgi:carbonic anhydrase